MEDVAVRKQRRFGKTVATLLCIALLIGFIYENGRANQFRDQRDTAQGQVATLKQIAEANGVKVPSNIPSAPASVQVVPGPTVTVVGPKGATGNVGATGSTGAAGVKGDNGLPGPPGSAGTNGTDGTSGRDGTNGQTVYTYSYEQTLSDGSVQVCTYSTVQPLVCNRVTGPTTTTTAPTTTTTSTTVPATTTTTAAPFIRSLLGG